MTAQEKFAPYLNRFTTLLQQHATAVLEFKCKDGKVTVNLSHELGGVEKAQPTIHLQNPSYRSTQKKAVKPSQLRRLKKRAAARAEQASVASAEQAKCFTSTKNIESEKDATEKVKDSAESAEKAMTIHGKAEEAKVDLDKSQAESDDSDGPCVISAEETPTINLSLEDLIKENSWHRCDQCDYKNKSIKRLKIHKEKMHEEITTKEKVDSYIKCNICGHKCGDEETFTKHFEKTDFYLKKCSKCDLETETCGLVHLHRERFHEERLTRFTRVSDYSCVCVVCVV